MVSYVLLFTFPLLLVTLNIFSCLDYTYISPMKWLIVYFVHLKKFFSVGILYSSPAPKQDLISFFPQAVT